MMEIIINSSIFLFIFVLNKNKELKLSDCNTKTEGIIKEILESEFDDKMLEYGIVPGVGITVISRAAFGGPIYIGIGPQRIAIRKKRSCPHYYSMKLMIDYYFIERVQNQHK